MAQDNTNDLPIHASVSPSLHPLAIAPHASVLADEKGGSGKLIFSAAQSALASLYRAATDTENAYVAIREPLAPGERPRFGGPGRMTDQTIAYKIDPVKHAQFTAAATQRFESVATGFDRSLQTINDHVAAIDRDIATALADPARDRQSVSIEQGQIREYVRTMKDEGERAQFIMEQVGKKGGVRVIDATLGNESPWLSGLSPERAESLLEYAREKLAPRAWKQRNAARLVMSHLQNASTTFVNRYREIATPAKETAGDKATRRVREGVA
jgi:hypothetical protein